MFQYTKVFRLASTFLDKLNEVFQRWVIKLYETQYFELNLYLLLQVKSFNFRSFLNSFAFLLTMILLLYLVVVFLYFYSRLN